MAIWITKNFVNAPFDVLLRDFRQHYFAMSGPEEMLMLKSREVGDTRIFIRLPELEYRFLYPGFEACSEDDLPALLKLVSGSEIGYRALALKRASSVH